MPRPQAENAISLKVRCPVCFAEVGESCSTPTNTTRRPVTWFHSSRTTKGAAYLTHHVGMHASGGRVEAICSCGWSAVVRAPKSRKIDEEHAMRVLAPEAGDAHLRMLREDVGASA